MAAAKLKRLTVLLCVLLVLLVPAPCRAGSYNGEITVYVTDSGDCSPRLHQNRSPLLARDCGFSLCFQRVTGIPR